MCNVGFAYSSVSTIHENADRIEESAKCLDNIKMPTISDRECLFVEQDYHSPIRMNRTKNYGCLLHFYCIRYK